MKQCILPYSLRLFLFLSVYRKKKRRSLFLYQLNIVLVEPEIPQNTGNISRTCALTGARLHLVGPLGFRTDDRYLKRAGLDYWHLLDVSYYQSLEDFFAKNEGPFYYFSTKARQIHSDIRYPEKCYLVFGKESAGLPEELLKANPESCVRIPMLNHPDARSLNLSNSAAVGAYEVLRQWKYPELLCRGQLHRLHW
ncbi:tRNA (uridine(34)/cytosine(34)/5-carboxymethylaminomethyluridine(34)-2'-O)-methyltransferase TrmL [Ruminococcaceae bacterium CPB6]|nr:tRNA (uridine(34)/cytosine(34)/5-carboxymethylaminomethyluridine(34)-2'-O)-methyltransferase TrmL [Ruminococcaceae bacterium CPB6]